MDADLRSALKRQRMANPVVRAAVADLHIDCARQPSRLRQCEFSFLAEYPAGGYPY